MITADDLAKAQQGLTTAEAQLRLAASGPNELPASDRRSFGRIVVGVLREPMFALLILASALYLALGDRGEALLLCAFATLSVSIVVIQEGRSERVLAALRDLTSPRALVLRAGVPLRIPGREVVCDDSLLLTEGDRVPADARLISAEDLQTDESLLTGESLPVVKRAEDGADRVFSGTLIVRGRGLAVVMATGAATELGRIGGSLASIVRAPPRLQSQVRQLVRSFAIVALVLSAAAVLLYGLLRDSWLQALLGGVALGMSLLPEEFPLVLSVYMVMGAWRLSRSQVLTRQAATIETLGAATVLCTDKTGTLTRNQMTVAALSVGSDCWEAGDDAAQFSGNSALGELLHGAQLASPAESQDPMERALHVLAPLSKSTAPPDGAVLREYPLRHGALVYARAWSDLGASVLIAAKGAPEAVAALCQLEARQLQEVQQQADGMARRGMRVLGVARRHALPGAPAELPVGGWEYLGLLGFADPLREGVPQAVSDCRAAGIRVVMITGDHPQTARAIARQAGIDAEQVLSGVELAALDATALAAQVRTVSVYARIDPQQKLRIVQAFRANGEIVAMTGDGVNDAPSLKAAHIGIAMGRRGTDVAREAASLVLLDDDFGSIVQAVRLGRRIYDNLRKAMSWLLAIHVPIAGLALLPLLFGLPLILTPMLIALLELIIDPSCSIALEAEPEEAGLMRRPPRDPQAPLLSKTMISWSLLQGLMGFLLTALLLLSCLWRGLPADETRALLFVATVGVLIVLILVNRTFAASPRAALAVRNPALWIGFAATTGLLAGLLRWPAARGFLGLGPLHADDLAIAGAAVVLLFFSLQLSKRLLPRSLMN